MRRPSGAETALSVFEAFPDGTPGPAAIGIRLVDGLRTIEPTWAEAVAVVQAVCAGLEPRRTPPAIGDIRISASGQVTFPPGGIVDDDVAIQLTARLLARLAQGCVRPLEVCDAIARADYAPMSYRTASGFGASLTCVRRDCGARYLAAYVREVHRALAGQPQRQPPSVRPPRDMHASAFGLLNKLRRR